MKASTTYVLSLLLATATVASAQTSAQDSAVNEAVLRQAGRIALRQKLEDAKAAEGRHDLVTAAKLYDDSWEIARNIGPENCEPEAAQARAGVATVRMELAHAAQSRGDYRDATVQINDVLRVDPSNAAALDLRRANDKILAEQAGTIPDAETQARVPGITKEKVDLSTQVQNARLLYEMGKMDEAAKILVQVAKQDPQNQAAYYYLNLINEKKYNESMNKRDVASRKAIVDIEDAWYTPPNRDLLPIPNQYARTNLIFTGKGRQVIYSKLDRIKLDEVKYENLPLGEVINNLFDQAKRRDPERRGINFIINQNVDTGASGGVAPGAPAAVDPTTGLPIAAAPAEAVDMSQISIKILPPLTDVSLAQVLDAIVKVADRPIKYSIEEYAVVFSLKGRDPAPLYTRIIKVDPNTFEQGLQSVTGFDFGAIAQASNTGGGGGGGGIGGGGGGLAGGAGGIGGGGNQGGLLTVPRIVVAGSTTGGGGIGGGTGQGAGLRAVTRTNDMTAVSAAVRTFFLTLGVDLNPPKSVFFNDREGSIVVRATLQDLDVIETAVQVLNIAPPQINIKAKFVEVAQNDTRALGFDWYLGNFLMLNGNVGAQGGTAPSFGGVPTPANPGGVFPGVPPSPLVPNGTALLPSGSDQLATAGLRNAVNAPAVATITGILTDPQFRVVIRALQQRDGADLLTESSVTTLSGRQTQVQVVDLRTIVIGTSLTQTSGTGTGGIGTLGGGGVGGVVAPSVNYPTATLPFGPTLDVVPYVSADGFTIQMTIIPTYTEFLGYDPPGQFIPQAQAATSGGGAAVPLTAQLPLPHFRVRQVTTSANVWDGQTVVLGGLISESVTKQKDQVPVLGDLPILGRLFRSESSQTQKKNLMIFVTPTIIDPAGNRFHSEDEMPFAQNAIPVQPQPAAAKPAQPVAR
jgi:general secretion pathway protein D